MNYVRFKEKKKYIYIYFGSKPTSDWSLIKEIQKLKSFGFKFDGVSKEWYITFEIDQFNPKLESKENFARIIKHLDEKYSSRFLNFLQARYDKFGFSLSKKQLERNKRIKNFTNRIIEYDGLYTHQKEDILTLSKSESTLLANDMGTGKTRTCVVYSELQDFKKVLIIAPASLKFNWEREILMINKNAKIAVLPEYYENISDNTKYFIINYDMLIKEFQFKKHEVIKGKEIISVNKDSFLYDIDFDLLLIDEAHYIKNESKRTKSALLIAKNVPHVVPITGTPIKSKVKDIYNLLLAIEHPLSFGGFFDFGRKYCGAIKTDFGWNFNGASNLEELHKELRPYMIRRLKSECLDLPPKIISEVFVELSKEGRSRYNTAFDNYINFVAYEKFADKDIITKNILLDRIKDSEHLVKLNLLKQVCTHDKVSMIMDRIDTLLDENDDRKVVIFTQYTSVLNKLFTAYNKISVKLDGSTKPEDRQRVVDKFQTKPKIRLFIANTLAGGVGITLTKADTIIMCDLLWTPSDHSQAEDRIHRIGQHADVNILYFITKDTIEEDIYQLLNEKKKVIDKSVDNINYTNVNNKIDVIGDVIKKLKDKYSKKIKSVDVDDVKDIEKIKFSDLL